MQLVILLVGGGLRKVLGTSRAESFSAAANIFVGQTEAPLVIRPYLPKDDEFGTICGDGGGVG
jgi:CNT family concentrative nucleoside transporter